MKINNSRKRILEYLSDYRYNSILVRSFAIILGLLAVIMLIITWAVSAEMNRIITDGVGVASINSLAKTRDRIDVVMEEAIQISGQLSLDEDIYVYLLNDTKEIFGRDQVVKVKNKIELYSDVFDYLDSIYVYSNKGKYIVTNEGGGPISDFDDTTWLANLTEREYEPARMISRMKGGSYPPLLTYLQPLRLTQMQFLGGIIINVDMVKLQELIVTNSKAASESLTIVDKRSNIIFSSDMENLMSKINKVDFYNDINFTNEDGYQIIKKEGEEILVTVASSDLFDWKYISTVPLSAYADYSDSIRGFYTILFVVCLFLAIISAFVISLYSYAPVRNILDLLKNPDIYAEDYSGKIGFRKDETSEISLNILRNLYSNQQMQEEMKRYTNVMSVAQLTALQAQISPHFLYNTLENIRWRAMEICQGDNEVSHIILNLSEMLRISLENEAPIISMAEEIKNTKLYIEILQLRYEDKLKVVWDVAEECLTFPIVKVSLQPIIENAVYHGIKPARRQGTIKIVVRKEGHEMVIRIADDGLGMKQTEVMALNADLKGDYSITGDHIGVRNVNQRLKLLLGDEAGLALVSSENSGTIVTFRIPIQGGKEHTS